MPDTDIRIVPHGTVRVERGRGVGTGPSGRCAVIRRTHYLSQTTNTPSSDLQQSPLVSLGACRANDGCWLLARTRCLESQGY